MSTGRDRIWAITLRLARGRHERDYLRELSTESVVDAARERDLSVSARTVRRVLEAMVEEEVLERADRSDDERLYRYIGDSEPSEPVDISVDAPTSSFREGRTIYHLFADTGVESEPLSGYGTVVRVGLDPRENRFSRAIRADATEPPLSDDADLVVLHPPCQAWAIPTSINGDPADYPQLVDEAREVGEELGDDYIIENVPQAPLDDPVVLEGHMFGLPVPYKRAFETSFAVPQPDRGSHVDLVDGQSDPMRKDDGNLGCFIGDKDLWRAAKGVSGDYPGRELKASGIPAAYIHYLATYWLRSRGVGS